MFWFIFLGWLGASLLGATWVKKRQLKEQNAQWDKESAENLARLHAGEQVIPKSYGFIALPPSARLTYSGNELGPFAKALLNQHKCHYCGLTITTKRCTHCGGHEK